MLKRLKQYLYNFWCHKDRICSVQNNVVAMNPLYYGLETLYTNKGYPYHRILHRTLLWDDCEPKSQMHHICSVRRNTPDIYHIMWNKKNIEALVRQTGMDFYFKYPRKIQQADIARYIVIKHYGGIYFDFDISMNSTLDTLLIETGLLVSGRLPESYCILFEEHRWKNVEEAVGEKDQSIRFFLEPKYRTEALVRVANYAMLCSPEHPFMEKVIEECQKRASLEIKCDYDVLFTTGPDVVSHVYHLTDEYFRKANNIVLVPQEKHKVFIVHHCSGVWRN